VRLGGGGAALHVRVGDKVVVVAYRWEEAFSGASYVLVDPSDKEPVDELEPEGDDRGDRQDAGRGRRKAIGGVQKFMAEPMRN